MNLFSYKGHYLHVRQALSFNQRYFFCREIAIIGGILIPDIMGFNVRVCNEREFSGE